MRFSRNTLAALLTIAALGALAAVALASGGSGTTTAPRPTAETDPPAQTRTVTSDDGTADQGPGDAPATPRARHDRGDDDGPGHDFEDDHRGGGNRGPGGGGSGRH
jgi:hypothetical protein